MLGAAVAGAFDPVAAVPGALDNAGVGPVPARGIEVAGPGAIAALNVNEADAVQQESAATLPTGTDPRRPTKDADLRQRPVMTLMPLVHTEEVAAKHIEGT